MASEYRNPYSKKYSKVSEKELHTVVPFTKDIRDNARYKDLREETDRLTKEYVKQFKDEADNFQRMIVNLTDQKREMTANQRKALKKIERGARTIADFRASQVGKDAFALARLKSGMEELLGGISTMQKYELLDIEYGRGNYPDTYAQNIYDLTAKYGQLIFQTGRRFNKELTPSTMMYTARMNQIGALRGAYRELGQYSSAKHKYRHRMDVTLVALVSATLHCNVTEAVERVELYRRYQGGPDVDEMTWEDFYNFSEGAYPEMQRILDEQRAIEEENARQMEEANRLIDIALGMQDILNANYAFYTGEHFDEGIYTTDELLDEYTEEVPDDENGADIASALMAAIQYPEAWDQINSSLSYIAECLMNPITQFAKAVASMQVGMDLGLSFSDLLGFPLASLFFTLNLSITSIDMLSQLTSASTSFLIGSVSKLGKLISGDDEDKDEDEGSGPSEFSKNHPIASGVGKLILNVVSIGLKAFSLGFSVISSVISTAFTMFTGLLSSMLKMLKEIFKTSQIMEAISNILSLCITMFFMPFFTSFGNALLETVFNILLWTRDKGMSFIEDYGNGFIEVFTQVAEFFIDNKERLAEIATEFIETVCESIFTLAPDFMQFVCYMTEAFLDNKELLFNMLSEGIEVGKELIRNKIFKMYMYYGTLFMRFIDANADWIKDVFEKAMGVVDVCLGAFSWVMDYLLLFCVALGGAIGSLVGLAGVATLSAHLAEKIIREGLKKMAPIVAQEYFKSMVAKGILSGGLIGAGLGLLFYTWFFSFGRGGYIPATPGGLLSIVAEKETEYIIPESKMYLIRGHNNIILSFNDDVYMLDNPTAEIKTIATQVTQTSYYR